MEKDIVYPFVPMNEFLYGTVGSPEHATEEEESKETEKVYNRIQANKFKFLYLHRQIEPKKISEEERLHKKARELIMEKRKGRWGINRKMNLLREYDSKYKEGGKNKIDSSTSTRVINREFRKMLGKLERKLKINNQ